MNNLIKAIEILEHSNATCVVLCEKEILTSTKRGVAPLIDWLEEGKNLSECSAADRVIGNGAAFLYVLLKIKEVYASVISKAALETLQKNQINVCYDIVTEKIKNRDQTGFCPIETAVEGETDPLSAYHKIKNRLAEMQKQK